MANFNNAFKKFYGIEHSKPTNILHHNSKEKGLTFWGIYESAHPTWEGWTIIYDALKIYNGNMEHASEYLSFNNYIIEDVKKFYKTKFWDVLRLDLIIKQKIAEELFFFYINTGNKKQTIRMAQMVVGVELDGFIGINTITALNNFDKNKFDKLYDIKEIEYYARLVQSNSKRYLLNLVGWIRRAVKI
jgi:lysozyme family protein